MHISWHTNHRLGTISTPVRIHPYWPKGREALQEQIVLFGIGFGNATSLPPLIAQTEFVAADVTRVVALIVGVSQATYAFAPAAFGLIRALAPHTAGAAAGAAPGLFAAAALAQGLAIGAFLAGRR